MRKFKKALACFLTGLLLLLSCGGSALAEGFSYTWDGDVDNTGGPHCKALFMVNLDTNTVVYTLNPDEQLPMASLTKIMSYIVAYENIPDLETRTITVPAEVETELADTGSSLAGVSVGEELTGLQLLYLMMVPSGNDAALTLAKYVDSLYAAGEIGQENTADSSPDGSADDNSAGDNLAGDTNAGDGDSGAGDTGSSGDSSSDYSGKSYFVEKMNEKAKELGCENTNFTNPHGLHNENHYSTARDMAVITQYAMALPNFTTITSTTAYRKPATNVNSEEEVKTTTNKLLLNYLDDNGISYYYQSATGIKTGSHDQAGYCVAASATAYGYTYVAIALGDMDGYANDIHREMLDVRSLFRWAFSNLEKKTVAAQGDIISSVTIEHAFQKDELLLAAGENAGVILPSSVDSTSVVVTTDVPESVQAPIEKGDAVGTAILSYADEEIARIPLVAAESVAKSELIAGWETGKELFSTPWFLVILAVIAVLIIVYIILILLYRRKQKQLRRVRKFRKM